MVKRFTNMRSSRFQLGSEWKNGCLMHDLPVMPHLLSMKTKAKHSFPRWLSFRETVDFALARPAMLDGLYHVYAEAYDVLASRFPDSLPDIPEARRPMDGALDTELGALAKEITLAGLLNRTPLEPYFSIASTLRDALRHRELIPILCADDERWIDAIQIALTYNERRNSQLSSTPHMQAAVITFANAVHFFNVRGICLPLSGDQVMVDSKGVWSAIAATSTSPLMALGDIGAMHYMDAWVPDTAQYDLFDKLMFHNVFSIEHLLQTGKTASRCCVNFLTGSRTVTGMRDAFLENS